MKVDLQSLYGLHVTWCARLYSLAETPQLPPSPAFRLVLRGRYWSAKIDDIALYKHPARYLFISYSFSSLSLSQVELAVTTRWRGGGSSQIRRQQKSVFLFECVYCRMQTCGSELKTNTIRILILASSRPARPRFLSVCNCLKIHLGSVMVRDGQHLQGRSSFFYILFCNCYFMKVVVLKIHKRDPRHWALISAMNKKHILF
jgi:hypothetical protein